MMAANKSQKIQHGERLYYSIGEVAGMFSVNPSLIRFWEKEFDVIKPKRNKKGTRFFTTKDVDNLHLIYNLVKERGYTLQGAKQKINKNPAEAYDELQLINALKRARNFLLEIKKEL